MVRKLAGLMTCAAVVVCSVWPVNMAIGVPAKPRYESAEPISPGASKDILVERSFAFHSTNRMEWSRTRSSYVGIVAHVRGPDGVERSRIVTEFALVVEMKWCESLQCHLGTVRGPYVLIVELE